VTAAPGGGWSIERRRDTARALHGPWPAPGQRSHRVVGLCTVVGTSAIVLGSTQKIDDVDAEAAARHSTDVVGRGSGGGAVLVMPDAQVWLDAWVPRTDPLWDDDVIESSWWLGEAWVRGLETLGATGLLVHRGRATRTGWSDVVCFAGVGPGEVMSPTAKVVGIAQRRTRDGARLHSMALVSWSPGALLELLSLEARHSADAPRDADELDDAATDLRHILPSPWRRRDGAGIVAAVEDALLAALP
jgi:lipoate-protein ligase A